MQRASSFVKCHVMLLRMAGCCKPKPETIAAYWEKYEETQRAKAGGFKTNLHRWDRKPGSPLFSSLPEAMRPRAREELERLVQKCKDEGRVVTRWKYASLVANAAFIAKHDARSRSFPNRNFHRHCFFKSYRNQGRMAIPEAPATTSRKRKYTQGPRVAQISLDGV